MADHGPCGLLIRLAFGPERGIPILFCTIPRNPFCDAHPVLIVPLSYHVVWRPVVVFIISLFRHNSRWVSLHHNQLCMVGIMFHDKTLIVVASIKRLAKLSEEPHD